MKKQNKYEFLKLIGLHGFFFAIGTLLFVLSFNTPFLQNINVLFYRGIFLLVINSVMVVILEGFLIAKNVLPLIFNWRDLMLSVVVFFCFNIVFFTHLPVTAERSVSVFLLGYMSENSDKKFSKDELLSIFEERYLYENDAIGKRLDEQMLSGDVRKIDNGFIITSQGQKLVNIYKIISKMFGIKTNNIPLE